MTPEPVHRSRVLATPWPGAYAVLTDSARHFGKHTHATHGLGLLLRGAQGSASGRGPVEATAGDLITTNPGEVHDGRPLGGQARQWGTIYLEPALLGEVAGGEPRAVEITRPVIRDAQLARLLDHAFTQLVHFNEGTAGALACEEALADACGMAALRHTAEPRSRLPDGDVQRARQRLGDDVASPPSLAELARLAGLSRFQLLRRFRAVYGLPPHAWLMQQRTERARRLIQGGRSLSAAAQASGFADQSHMTRCFARQFGFTPGAWQRALRLQ